MLLRGVVVAVREVRNHAHFTPFVFLCFYSNCFSLRLHFYARSKVVTELRVQNSTSFRTVLIFVTSLRQLLFFVELWKTPKLFSFNCSFNWGKLFSSFRIVSEKIHVKVRDRIGATFKLSAAVAVYSPRVSLFPLISLIFLYITYVVT